MAQLAIAQTVSEIGSDAFKPGGLVTTGMEAIYSLLEQHGSQLEAKRAVMKQIKEVDDKIAEVKQWLKQHNIPIPPMDGSGVLDQLTGLVEPLRKWISEMSRRGHEVRQQKRLATLLAKTNYLAKLADIKNNAAMTGRGPNGRRIDMSDVASVIVKPIRRNDNKLTLEAARRIIEASKK